MEENNIQKSGQIKEKQSVKYRLKKNVAYVTNLTSIAALVAIIALLIVGKQYSNALTSYGFIQGDIGKAMTVLAGSQSSVRATIGYLDESAIKDQKNRYKQKREKFDKYFKNIEVNLHSSKKKAFIPQYLLLQMSIGLWLIKLLKKVPRQIQNFHRMHRQMR